MAGGECFSVCTHATKVLSMMLVAMAVLSVFPSNAEAGCVSDVDCWYQGTCSDWGTCLCDIGYYGEQCERSRTKPSSDRDCTSAADCNSHGTCTLEICICDSGYDGDKCDSSSSGLPTKLVVIIIVFSVLAVFVLIPTMYCRYCRSTETRGVRTRMVTEAFSEQNYGAVPSQVHPQGRPLHSYPPATSDPAYPLQFSAASESGGHLPPSYKPARRE